MKIIHYNVWNEPNDNPNVIDDDDILYIRATIRVDTGDEFNIHLNSKESPELAKKYLGMINEQCFLPRLDILGYKLSEDGKAVDKITQIDSYRPSTIEKSPEAVFEEIDKKYGNNSEYQEVKPDIKYGNVELEHTTFDTGDFSVQAKGAAKPVKRKQVVLDDDNQSKSEPNKSSNDGFLPEDELNDGGDEYGNGF
ncbi:hypothetical protein R4B61_07565 (plasmid) [Fructilactobacillus vespulae]|uniref:hypothetical protein n=1 Tax=Fructilactobacillus vespulae TaxID=1249630 RepID=UPI0039B5A4AF